MKRAFIAVAASLIVVTALVGAQQTTPTKVDPETAKIMREQEQRMIDAASKPAETIPVQQCSADTQAWTTDGSDRQTTMIGAVLIMVNGQIRYMPMGGTSHATMGDLVMRIHEMSVCQTSDADFQKQFNTYAVLQKHYEEERMTRYILFLYKHNLMDQFVKEDAAENK
ncbi:MAG TPA: hypothetical protein VGB94_10580 [Acidobacteriaceae bacterium]